MKFTELLDVTAYVNSGSDFINPKAPANVTKDNKPAALSAEYKISYDYNNNFLVTVIPMNDAKKTSF